MDLPPKVGDRVSVFDSKLWNFKDVGDNSQFWKPAEVLVVRRVDQDLVVDVRFEHDGRESKGHFVWGLQLLEQVTRK